MKHLLIVLAIAGCVSFEASAQEPYDPNHSSAQIETPPSAEKLQLIRRFMQATGLQARLDDGTFLERYAFIRELDWEQGRTTTTVLEAITGPIDALKSVYEKYRPSYQEAFESHINWEFTDEELLQMVTFLESPVGQHYLDGTWRMEAYTGTNMEETEDALVKEAVALYRSETASSVPHARGD